MERYVQVMLLGAFGILTPVEAAFHHLAALVESLMDPPVPHGSATVPFI